jgi:hypothetical protein
MKDKHLANGEPDVVYLQDVLDAKFGAGKTKVILPITDPLCRAPRRARLLRHRLCLWAGGEATSWP